jgi:hypothetical protein
MRQVPSSRQKVKRIQGSKGPSEGREKMNVELFKVTKVS